MLVRVLFLGIVICILQALILFGLTTCTETEALRPSTYQGRYPA
jgi:hypothetical protein